MRELKLKKTTVKLYENIREFPVIRKHEFTKLLMQDMQLGDSMDSVGRHFADWHKYIQLGQHREAVQEAKNLHNNFFNMINGIGIRSYSFATFVCSINDKPYEDLSKNGVDRTIRRLDKAGLTQGMVDDFLNEVKKKLTANFQHAFLIDTESVHDSLPQ